MQFGGRKKKISTIPQSELYGQHLQFYGQPPLENISLSEFETFAVERLKCKICLILLVKSNDENYCKHCFLCSCVIHFI